MDKPIRSVVRRIATNQASFGATENIYGTFLVKLERIENLF
jgi:hypothetical protein